MPSRYQGLPSTAQKQGRVQSRDLTIQGNRALYRIVLRDERMTARHMTARLRRRKTARQGQSLVQFALVVPLFMVLLTAIIEFGFLFNAYLATTFASRDASLIAAEAGNAQAADCVILQKIEQDVTAPADPSMISTVQIFWANQTNGQPATVDDENNVLANPPVNTYTRTGSMDCGGSGITVPYNLSGTAHYLYSDRCNILKGCALDDPDYDSEGRYHSTGVDTIGVEITYAYPWHTPLKSLLGFTGGGWTLTPANSMRMEPVL